MIFAPLNRGTLLLAGAFWLLGLSLSHANSWPKRHLALPIVRQSHPYSCGAAALLSVTTYWKKFEGGEAELMAKLKTTAQHGTPPENILAAAQDFGLNAEIREGLTLGDLRDALVTGTTAVLAIQAWPGPKRKINWKKEWESGHYAVLVGMDRRRAYFMDPATLQGYTYIPIRELKQRWHDYVWVAGKKRVYWQTAILIRGADNMSAEFPVTAIKMK